MSHVDLDMLDQLKALEKALDNAQNDITQALSRTSEINQFHSELGNFASAKIPETTNENIKSLGKTDRSDLLSEQFSNSTRSFPSADTKNSEAQSAKMIFSSYLNESTQLTSEPLFVARISSPLKQSYIPEPIIESDQENLLSTSLEFGPSVQAIINTALEASMDHQMSSNISTFNTLNEQADERSQTTSPPILISEPEIIIDETNDPEKKNTRRRESLLDPVIRLKELLAQSYIPQEPVIRTIDSQTPTQLGVTDTSQDLGGDEKSLLDIILDETSFGALTINDYNSENSTSDETLSSPKVVHDNPPKLQFANNDTSSFGNPINGQSWAPKPTNDSQLSVNSELSSQSSVDNATTAQQSFPPLSSPSEGYANQTPVGLEHYMTPNFGLKKNRAPPLALISADIRQLRSPVERKNAYVTRTKLLQQEDTGLILWLELNVKKKPITMFDKHKLEDNKSSISLPQISLNFTPHSSPLADLYSNPTAIASQPAISQSQSASFDTYKSTLFPTPSLTNSTNSTKSTKSSRASLDGISVQTSSLRYRPNSPPISPKTKTPTFFSGINRRGSTNGKSSRPVSFNTPPVMNTPSANSSSTSLSLTSTQNPLSSTTPKRQRRFSFQSVASRFSFNTSTSSASSFSTTIEETDDGTDEDNLMNVRVDDHALDKLCDVLPHADRDVLVRYLQKAGGKDDLMAVGLYIKDLKSGEIGA